MKKFLAMLAASAALVAAIPGSASAHENNGYGGRAWQDDDGAYGGFRQEFQHLYANLQHGVRDGAYSRGEARQFYWAINSLRNRLNAYWNDDGYLSRRERWDIQNRLERLHNDMHDAHDNGHAERDYGYYGNQGGYDGDQGYNRDDDRYQRR